jgi:hypothetical protein
MENTNVGTITLNNGEIMDSTTRIPNRLTQMLNDAPPSAQPPRAMPVNNGPSYTGLQAAVVEQAARLENQADRVEKEASDILQSASLFGLNAVTEITQDRLLKQNTAAGPVMERLERLRRVALDYATDLRALRDSLRGEATRLRQVASQMSQPSRVSTTPVTPQDAVDTDLRPYSLAWVPANIIQRLAQRQWTQQDVDEWCRAKGMQSPPCYVFVQDVMERVKENGADDEEDTFHCGACDKDVAETQYGAMDDDLGMVCKPCVEESKQHEQEVQARDMERLQKQQEDESEDDFGESLVDPDLSPEGDDDDEESENEDLQQVPDEVPSADNVTQAIDTVKNKYPGAKVRVKKGGRGRRKQYKIMNGTRNLCPWQASEDLAWLEAAEELA